MFGICSPLCRGFWCFQQWGRWPGGDIMSFVWRCSRSSRGRVSSDMAVRKVSSAGLVCGDTERSWGCAGELNCFSSSACEASERAFHLPLGAVSRAAYPCGLCWCFLAPVLSSPHLFPGWEVLVLGPGLKALIGLVSWQSPCSWISPQPRLLLFFLC